MPKIINSCSAISERNPITMDIIHYEGDIFEFQIKDIKFTLDNKEQLFNFYSLIKNKIKKIPYFGYGFKEDWK